MALKDTIHNAIAPTLAMLLAEFGVPAVLRRPYTVEQADGSVVMELAAVPGAAATYHVLLEQVTHAVAERLWGRETDSTIKGMMADTAPLQAKDVLILQEGVMAGQYVTVESVQPSEIGGVLAFGAFNVPAPRDRGFV